MSTAVAPRQSNTPMADRIEASLDRKSAGMISLSAKDGLLIADMGQAMEFAKLMSLSGTMIPKHLRDKPGSCLGICVQAYEWQISPFALANKSYEVNDRICYEASLYQAVVTRRAPISGRIKMEYFGEGLKRTCRVWATLADGSGDVDYKSPEIGAIKPQNSPLWKNDPDQQLFYFSVRSFARRHFPDVMMGIYTLDEMQDSSEILTQIHKPITLESLTSPKLATPAEVVTEQSAAGATDDQKQPEPEKPVALTSAQIKQQYLDRIAAATTILECRAVNAEINQMWEDGGPLSGEECGELIDASNARLSTLGS